MTTEELLAGANILTPSRAQQASAANLAEMIRRDVTERKFGKTGLPHGMKRLADAIGMRATTWIVGRYTYFRLEK